MSKFTYEEKLNIIKGYNENRMSQKEYAQINGVNKAQFQYWLLLYELHGDKAFKLAYTKYSAAFKLNVLIFKVQSGASLMDTAANFMLPSFAMVYDWSKKFELGGLDALEPKKKGRPSMGKGKQKNLSKQGKENETESLQQEVERLRMENAYLKKLNALVQNKDKSPNKTKHK
jgi:transposase